MQNRQWISSHNWWVDHANFNDLWQALITRYGKNFAYFIDKKGISYQDIERESQYYRQKFAKQQIVRINGLETNWLSQAIAAWTMNQLVVFYDPNWQKTNPIRYHLVMSEITLINWEDNPHLLLFTSGSTGAPKPIIRRTSLALYEAASYIEDIIDYPFECAVCLIKPWFGAITKHCLGMLCAGIPQYFDMQELKENSLVYGTPSLISNLKIAKNQTWQVISLTGERVNAHHVQTFKQCLHHKGFVLDAYGASECGVIARRKLTYTQLDALIHSDFHGTVLPGKNIFIDEQGLLFVQALQEPMIATGDLGILEANQLRLTGRCSVKRKIRGNWIDVSPLLNILATHSEIYHVELATEQTKSDQLVIYIAGQKSLNIHELYQWIFERLKDVKLLPQIILSHTRPKLGVTDKQFISHHSSCNTFNCENYITLIADAILSLSSATPKRIAFMDEPLEAQGFDSLDIVQLIIELEQKAGTTFPIHALLKTDTPKEIASLINIPCELGLLRTLTANSPPKVIRVLCIGSGIIACRPKLSAKVDILYTDIIYHQKQAFSIEKIAKLIIAKELKYLSQESKLFIAGFSINGLLAIELAYQLEAVCIPIKGVFILDPPNGKRLRYLKRKKIWLGLRSKLLNYLIAYGKNKWQKRHTHEIRKLAIINHPKRILNSPSLTVYTQGQLDQNPWLNPMQHHQIIELNYTGHLELVSTAKGIDSWLPLMQDFMGL